MKRTGVKIMTKVYGQFWVFITILLSFLFVVLALPVFIQNVGFLRSIQYIAAGFVWIWIIFLIRAWAWSNWGKESRKTGLKYSIPLTQREREVLEYLGTGMNIPEIAEEMMLAVGTVRSHVKRIYKKLRVHNREEAVDMGERMGML
jgi:DNA-binding CsgD family transcriptional regulator